MCKIVIIDTGIDINNKYINFKKIDGISIKKSINENEDYTISYYNENPSCIQDVIGHGTAVSGIISQHNSDSEIFVIKLFDWDSIQVDEDLQPFFFCQYRQRRQSHISAVYSKVLIMITPQPLGLKFGIPIIILSSDFRCDLSVNIICFDSFLTEIKKAHSFVSR